MRCTSPVSTVYTSKGHCRHRVHIQNFQREKASFLKLINWFLRPALKSLSTLLFGTLPVRLFFGFLSFVNLRSTPGLLYWSLTMAAMKLTFNSPRLLIVNWRVLIRDLYSWLIACSRQRPCLTMKALCIGDHEQNEFKTALSVTLTQVHSSSVMISWVQNVKNDSFASLIHSTS